MYNEMENDILKVLFSQEDIARRVAEMGYTNVQLTPPAFSGAEDTQRLLEKYGLAAVYTDLETFAASDSYDAAYIASPNLCHFDQAMCLLKNGKHVLLEKPGVLSARQTQQLIDTAKAHHVVYLEAMRLVFDDAPPVIQAALPEIGTLRRVTMEFTQYSSRYDRVRAGIVMYGIDPLGQLDVRPALRWTTRVSYVKTIESGDTVSYGRRFTAARPTRIATLPVGYADGYRRSFSNRAQVLLHGRRVSVVGSVCMDQVMVDATGLDVQMGDEAVLLGRQGEEEISCCELAQLDGTIPYEIMTGISARVPRVYEQQ